MVTQIIYEVSVEINRFSKKKTLFWPFLFEILLICNIKQKQKTEHNVFISIKGTSRNLWIFHLLNSPHIIYTMFTLLKLHCFNFYLFLGFNISWLRLSIYPLVHSFYLPSISLMIHSASISLSKRAGLPRIFTQQSITSYISEAENFISRLGEATQ